MAYWLLKTEPGTYSIEELRRDGVATWEGVRNPAAAAYLRQMREGDLAFIYHSGPKPAVVGVARVVREAYPDPTAWDPSSPYHDPRSSPGNPRWVQVDVAFVSELPRPVPLAELRQTPGLEGMPLLRLPRLSVQPVAPKQWEIIMDLAQRSGRGGSGRGSRRDEPQQRPDQPAQRRDRIEACGPRPAAGRTSSRRSAAR